MPKESNDKIQQYNQSVGNVLFNMDEKQLENFLVSLLGKPQVLVKRYYGSFEIDISTIDILHSVLESRMHQQNNATLIGLTFTVVFKDNTSITFTGIEHLQHHVQQVPVPCRAITINWQYLIKFVGKDTPEKQEITLTFQAAARIKGERFAYDGSYYSNSNQIDLRIQHTARSWGADIEALFSQRINQINKPLSIAFKFFYSDLYRLSETILPGILFIISLIFYINSNLHTNIYYIVCLFTTTYIISKIGRYILYKSRPLDPPSFILLNKDSITEKEKILQHETFNRVKLLINCIINIVVGVISCIIYDYIFKK